VRSTGTHRPESLSEITRQLAEHVGPIAGVLVRRASSSSTNLREMCDALAQEIASPAARQKFLSAVHSHLRISGQY
jgi:serine/threonine-protein kinase